MGFLDVHRGVNREPFALLAPPEEAPFFLKQVFSCLIAIGLAENDARSAGAALGWTREELLEIARRFAPETLGELTQRPQPEEIEFDEEEEQLRALLERCRADGSRETDWLVSALARRALCANHLWQDLGFPSRDLLNELMRERFPELATRNANNMKWKKFFYRCLCELEGFTLCAAPSCAECPDHAACFGEETGLARMSSDQRA